MRETKFSDVCGTIDELRRMLSSSRLEPHETEEIRGLVQDALYMIGRMEDRLREYERFRERLKLILEEALKIKAPETKKAEESAEKIYKWISRGMPKSRLEEILETAEEIRRIADELESSLRAYKERCLDLIELYGKVKGLRDWGKDEKKRIGKPLPILMPLEKILESIQEWLPPEPHRTKILEFIKAGRAHLLPKKRRQQPIVQFEDGGSIPLHKVRYSERIKNFYHADNPPRVKRERILDYFRNLAIKNKKDPRRR